jgi:hypothetical protein
MGDRQWTNKTLLILCWVLALNSCTKDKRNIRGTLPKLPTENSGDAKGPEQPSTPPPKPSVVSRPVESSGPSPVDASPLPSPTPSVAIRPISAELLLYANDLSERSGLYHVKLANGAVRVFEIDQGKAFENIGRAFSSARTQRDNKVHVSYLRGNTREIAYVSTVGEEFSKPRTIEVGDRDRETILSTAFEEKVQLLYTVRQRSARVLYKATLAVDDFAKESTGLSDAASIGLADMATVQDNGFHFLNHRSGLQYAKDSWEDFLTIGGDSPCRYREYGAMAVRGSQVHFTYLCYESADYQSCPVVHTVLAGKESKSQIVDSFLDKRCTKWKRSNRPAIVIDHDSVVHLFYANPNEKTLIHAFQAEDKWSIETIGEGVITDSINHGGPAAVAINSQILVVFVGQDEKARVWKNEKGFWNEQRIDSLDFVKDVGFFD